MSTYRDDIAHVAGLPLPWETLYGCNVLITGATGLLGECLTDVLMSHTEGNIQVWASGRDDERAKSMFSGFSADPRFHYVHWDVMQPLPTTEDFHYVIHAASSASPRFFATQPVETILSNILGIRTLMEYGIKHNMQRLLFVSTGEVYGEGDGRYFTEEYSGYVDSLSPRSCYPAGKRTAETLCASYAEEYGADFVVARPCHIYGPHFTPHDNRVYAQFIRNIINGEDIIMKSDGSQHRSWCYIVDAVKGCLGLHVFVVGDVALIVKCGPQHHLTAEDVLRIEIAFLLEFQRLAIDGIACRFGDVAEYDGDGTPLCHVAESYVLDFHVQFKQASGPEAVHHLGFPPCPFQASCFR